MEYFGKLFILLGVFLIVVGMLFFINARLDFLSWFGNLPGDIKIEKTNIRFYFPLMSGILLSLFFSFIFNFFKKIF